MGKGTAKANDRRNLQGHQGHRHFIFTIPHFILSGTHDLERLKCSNI